MGCFRLTRSFFFFKRIKIGILWCEIAKDKFVKITDTYFGDKSQKIAPAEKKQLYGSENTLIKYKNLHLKNHWANFNHTWHKASLGVEDSRFYRYRVSNSQELTLWDNDSFVGMYFLFWTGFSCERCAFGPLVSCMFYMIYVG